MSKALAAVGLEPLVKSLPQGLDTVASEAGARFSGGERHRIAFARVLLANTPALLLDEPMTALDPATEHALMETLFDTMREKTLVMITHHLQDIECFDRVVFIEDGRVALDGSPAELERTSQRYRTLLAFDRGL